MKYALGNMLNGGIQGIDPSAKAYINTIVSAGASVSSTQKTAINEFYKTTKKNGYYDQIKRLYLPIWSIAAPNAVDLITTTSGTFVGGVTQSAGFIQGNGTSGYLNINNSASALGLTTSEGGYCLLIKAADTRTNFRCLIGASTDGNNENYLASDSATNIRFSYNSFTSSVLGPIDRASQNGVISAARTAGTLSIRRRITSGVSSLHSSTRANAGSVSNLNIFASALNVNGTPLYFSDAQIGAVAVDLGLSVSDQDLLTLALKNLWETCTGLVLP